MAKSRKNIILGSQSPRRRELLAALDIPFTVVSIDADESFPPELQAGDIPYYISRAKARAYEPRLTDSQLLITSDTIVWADGHMLGKPHDETEAFAMLRSLSGKTHQVYTAVTFAHMGNPSLGISESRNLDLSENPTSHLQLSTRTSPSPNSRTRKSSIIYKNTGLLTKPVLMVSRSGSAISPAPPSMAPISTSWASPSTSSIRN